MLTHFSLFTGIGGIDLAAEWAGFETVGQVEWADYPTKVLEKHWPNVPRWRDIRDVTGTEITRTIGNRHIDLLSGGFPCQPFSTSGKRKGKDDDRFIWPEMLRVISELKPTWVIGENVTGIISSAIDQVFTDLENESYTTQAFVIPAAGVNAIHKRDRVFIVAYTNEKRRKTTKIYTRTNTESTFETPEEWSNFFVFNRGNNNIEFRKEDKSKLCRNDDGVSEGLDAYRLGCLGNAVVPQQVYPILQAIADIEMG